MFYEINDIKISYKVKGVGVPIILLHGWGMKKETFDSLARDLSSDFKVFQIDLPGFGESNTPRALRVSEYADLLHSFVIDNCDCMPIVLGHSFGGRVAICYASKYKVKKLILVSTPGIRYFNLKSWVKVKIYRVCKRLKWNILKGSKDYKNANKILRDTLVMAVNENLRSKLPLIDVKTLLIWGQKDKDVRLKIGKDMNRLISNSELVIMSKTSHFPYLERYRYFLVVLKYFLMSDLYDSNFG